jgi:hypothetical protein
MYFGNYPEDYLKLWGSQYPSGWVVDRYPTGPNGERMKVMQDVVAIAEEGHTSNALFTMGYYTNHDKPNSLYTDGSVVARSIEKLGADGITRAEGQELYYIDK